jgi:TetR/AcrR family transcriptional regulator, transcriptional repressor of bet genes
MRRTRASEEVRREQILRAALEVAAKEGLAGLTVRAVATEAGLSHALVLFHFKRKKLLLQELLRWLLDSTSVMEVPEDIARFPRALDRLHALLRQEVARLSHDPRHIRVFLEFWALGVREESIRSRISEKLERYRSAFRIGIEALLEAEPATFPGITADGLAALSVSWIQECAVQAMIDPEHFDSDEYLAAVRGILGQLIGSTEGG